MEDLKRRKYGYGIWIKPWLGAVHIKIANVHQVFIPAVIWKNKDVHPSLFGSVSKPCTPVVHIKIAGIWMFIPLKMVLIGIDPSPFLNGIGVREPNWTSENVKMCLVLVSSAHFLDFLVASENQSRMLPLLGPPQKAEENQGSPDPSSLHDLHHGRLPLSPASALRHHPCVHRGAGDHRTTDGRRQQGTLVSAEEGPWRRRCPEFPWNRAQPHGPQLARVLTKSWKCPFSLMRPNPRIDTMTQLVNRSPLTLGYMVTSSQHRFTMLNSRTCGDPPRHTWDEKIMSSE